MIDLAQLRREPELVTAALARRGVSSETVASLIQSDKRHRELMQEAETLRARVKVLSRQVGEARKNKETERGPHRDDDVDRTPTQESRRHVRR